MSNNAEERRREFLERAKDAEERAEKAPDAMIRQSWQKIAEGYRDLARRQ